MTARGTFHSPQNCSRKQFHSSVINRNPDEELLTAYHKAHGTHSDSVWWLCRLSKNPKGVLHCLVVKEETWLIDFFVWFIILFLSIGNLRDHRRWFSYLHGIISVFDDLFVVRHREAEPVYAASWHFIKWWGSADRSRPSDFSTDFVF